MATIAYATLETGDLANFDEVIASGGNISAASVAALASTAYGLEVEVEGDTVEVYGELAFSNSDNELTVEISLDPNTLTMSSGDEFTILRIRYATGDDDVMALFLNYDGSNYRVRFAAYEDDATANYSSYETITDAEHSIELRLERAASDVAGDGQCQMWIDTVLEQTVSGLDNYDLFPTMDECRIGAIEGIDSGTSGIFYLDELSLQDSTAGATSGFLAKAGAFSLNTSAGNQSITGVGFQPKVVLFLPTNDTADGVSEHAHLGFGVGISSSDRRCITCNDEDNQGTTDCNEEHLASKCIAHNQPGTGTAEYEADFVSMDADGFTINITTAPGSAKRVGYLALGGSGLTNVASGHFQGDNATGNQAVTGVGFQPDCVLFFNTTDTTAPDSSYTEFRASIGWAISSSKRGFSSWASKNDEVTSDTARRQETDECIQCIYPAGGVEGEADFVSMDADGFTVNWGVASAAYIHYVALKGSLYDCGTITSQTGTGEFSDTSMSFEGAAIILMSFCNAANAGEVDGLKASIGFATSLSDRFVVGCISEDGQGSSDTDSFQDDGAVYKNYDYAQSVLGAIDFVSFNADGFTLDQTDADPSGNQILWLVLGEAAGDVVIFRRRMEGY